MRLRLPDVTLVMIQTRREAELELARMTLEDALDKVEFGDVLILTDKPTFFPSSRVRFHRIDDAPDKLGWCRQLWYEVPPLLRTSHALQMQWDAGVWDAGKWRFEYLNYDYIGAPWWYKDYRNVGNSGFSLISTRLRRYLYRNRVKFPCTAPIEDDLMCRTYRPDLEKAGFTWAPTGVAYDFAWEGCNQPRTTQTHFGFHAMFNWPLALTREQVDERITAVKQSPYIASSYMMEAFCKENPELARELFAEEIKAAQA